MWKNGIHWYNDDGVETLVEQTEDNQCVQLLMSCPKDAEKKMIEQHCEYIKSIIDLQEEYCPILQCKEYFLGPTRYPLCQPTYYKMDELLRCISQDEKSILCVDSADVPPIATCIADLLPTCIQPKEYLHIHEVGLLHCTSLQ